MIDEGGVREARGETREYGTEMVCTVTVRERDYGRHTHKMDGLL